MVLPILGKAQRMHAFSAITAKRALFVCTHHMRTWAAVGVCGKRAGPGANLVRDPTAQLAALACHIGESVRLQRPHDQVGAFQLVDDVEAAIGALDCVLGDVGEAEPAPHGAQRASLLIAFVSVIGTCSV